MKALFKATYEEWSEDKAARLGAALAYYTVFSLAPLLLISISIAGLFFKKEAAQGQILASIGTIVGPKTASAIQSMVISTGETSSGIAATIVGIFVMLLGASGVFGQLQDSMNTIWGVEPKPGRGIMGFLRDRLFTMSLVLAIGFLLLVSAIVSAALAALGSYLTVLIPAPPVVWQVANFVISFGVITVLFALIFKYIPDAIVRWSDVWPGAAFTALLFVIGKFGLGYYLGSGKVESTFGAAASVIIILVWVYYSSQILFFGAEFTQAYARFRGHEIQPAENAQFISEPEPQMQGRKGTARTVAKQTEGASWPQRDRQPRN